MRRAVLADFSPVDEVIVRLSHQIELIGGCVVVQREAPASASSGGHCGMLDQRKGGGRRRRAPLPERERRSSITPTLVGLGFQTFNLVFVLRASL